MLKTHSLERIGVVVRNLDEAVSNYTKIYGIQEWNTQEHAPAHIVSYGRELQETPGTWRSAIGTTIAANEGEVPLTFELIEPTGGESPFHEHLRTKREGICFLRVAADGEGTVEEHFERLGIREVYRAGDSASDVEGRVFFDTRPALGGFLLEIVKKPQDANPQCSSGPAAGLLPPQKMYHFGVLVHDVLAAIEHYRTIFGIERFECKTWETGFGRLDKPQYRGELMDHGYFTAQGFAGDFGFEIIQSNHGSSHYNREFFDIRGPGIHHIFPWLAPDDAAWQEAIDRMAAAGHELCMGSTLRGEAAEFGYFDTFDALGGYLIEIVVRRRPAKPEYMAPDWVIDFKELT